MGQSSSEWRWMALETELVTDLERVQWNRANNLK